MQKVLYYYCSIPGDHLFLFAGSTTTATQVLAGRGQEVEEVVPKGLICQWEQYLERGNTAVRSKRESDRYWIFGADADTDIRS